jgi:FkbM family methyltransferase
MLRLLCPPDAALDLPFEVDFYGLRYRGTLASFLDWTVFFYGAYCRAELALLSCAADCLHAAGRPVTYLDVGTNVGHHLLFMSPRVERAYGFEPWAPVLERAREQLALNHLRNAEIFALALGERNGHLQFYPPASANHGTGSFVESWGAAERDRAAAPLILEVRVGDELLEERRIGNAGVVKIDVEGFEAPVCRGLSRTFSRFRPFVLMELSAQGAREFGSEDALRLGLYPAAQILRVHSRGRHGLELRPYRFKEELAELFIVPDEYRAPIEAALNSGLTIR